MKKDLAALLKISAFPLIFLLVCWTIFLIGRISPNHQYQWGILPRKAEGLPGIITSVFIHGDLAHIAANSIPFLILSSLINYFYGRIALGVTAWIWLMSGFWLWVGGRNSDTHPSWHIGASTTIYGFASFLFFSGVFRRHRPLMVISLLVVFLYGSMVWGVLPIDPHISWDGHLFGAIAGLLVAFNYRSEGPQKATYQWEEDDDDQDDGPWNGPPEDDGEPPSLEIRYHVTK